MTRRHSSCSCVGIIYRLERNSANRPNLLQLWLTQFDGPNSVPKLEVYLVPEYEAKIAVLECKIGSPWAAFAQKIATTSSRCRQRAIIDHQGPKLASSGGDGSRAASMTTFTKLGNLNSRMSARWLSFPISETSLPAIATGATQELRRRDFLIHHNRRSRDEDC